MYPAMTGLQTFFGNELPGSNQSHGIFTAVLSRSDPIGTRFHTFSITSTLQIQDLEKLNESSLTCERVTAVGSRMENRITIIVSGEW
jgi:hypothetical protein